jgi:hypothetical protein
VLAKAIQQASLWLATIKLSVAVLLHQGLVVPHPDFVDVHVWLPDGYPPIAEKVAQQPTWNLAARMKAHRTKIEQVTKDVLTSGHVAHMLQRLFELLPLATSTATICVASIPVR